MKIQTKIQAEEIVAKINASPRISDGTKGISMGGIVHVDGNTVLETNWGDSPQLKENES